MRMNIFKRKQKLTGEEFKTKNFTYKVWLKENALPLIRFAENIRMMEMLSLGISGEEMGKIVSAMRLLSSKGLNKPENSSKMSALVEHIATRGELVIHLDIIVNIVALHAIRSDENPFIVDAKIHKEKVNDLRKYLETENGYAFFQQAGLKELSGYINSSPEELAKLLSEATEQVSQLNQNLDDFLSILSLSPTSELSSSTLN